MTGPSRPLRDFFGNLAKIDRSALVILLWLPFALALGEYCFVPVRAPGLFPWLTPEARGSWDELALHLWWVGGVLLTTVVIPMGLLWFFAGRSPRSYGLRFHGKGGHGYWKAYLILFLLMLPVLAWVSQRPDFLATYPLFRPARGAGSPEFLVFEAAYCLQFFAVEFFFRGVLTLGLKPAFGRASVLVMLAPYCALHFHKPLPEALGAIGAGLTLGALAWETETVVYGFLLHYGVALTMDLLALLREFH